MKGRYAMLKRKPVFLLSLLLFFAISLQSAFAKAQIPDSSIVHKPGSLAYKHLKVLSDDIGARVVGAASEAAAKDYIHNEFKGMGYETIVQAFSYTRRGTTFSSANVIATKPGKSTKQVIVGGHYDSVSASKGADDSASGISVILEVAEVLKHINTPYTIKFVAFGAEETGLRGSSYYVSQMSLEDIQSTVVMINLDSLAVGDYMYVYGNEGEAGFARDQALNIAEKLKLSLQTNPGLNPHYPAGTTGDWSDHAPFKAKGIPYAYFEATNWELGDLDGYTQTVKDGEIWHTPKDTLEYIESNYPGRLQEHLSTFSKVLTDLLKFMNKTSTSK
jgi:alkaline phosphatase isozyme conversion protein